MKGWLIYDKEGAARNRTFIDFWFAAAEKRGVDLELLRSENPLPEKNPACAVVRTINPALSFRLEERGIPVYNPASVSEICNDKWKTYQLASRLGVPFPQTEYVPDPAVMPSHPYPYVLKACAGHGGTQVFMVKNGEEEQAAKQALSGIPSVLQEPVSHLGKDLRVYVLGGKILAGMLRVSHTDFRSNFCLGGTAAPHELTAEERTIVEAFTNALPLGLAGIDLIYHDGKPVFNEIEDVVGCRMLYSQTPLDPVTLYLDWILERM